MLEVIVLKDPFSLAERSVVGTTPRIFMDPTDPKRSDETARGFGLSLTLVSIVLAKSSFPVRF
jgi:hypothetical protein